MFAAEPLSARHCFDDDEMVEDLISSVWSQTELFRFMSVQLSNNLITV